MAEISCQGILLDAQAALASNPHAKSKGFRFRSGFAKLTHGRAYEDALFLETLSATHPPASRVPKLPPMSSVVFF